MNIVVEFFGVPRARAGRNELELPSGTVAEVLAHIEAYPHFVQPEMGRLRLPSCQDVERDRHHNRLMGDRQ